MKQELSDSGWVPYVRWNRFARWIGTQERFSRLVARACSRLRQRRWEAWIFMTASQLGGSALLTYATGAPIASSVTAAVTMVLVFVAPVAVSHYHDIRVSETAARVCDRLNAHLPDLSGKSLDGSGTTADAHEVDAKFMQHLIELVQTPATSKILLSPNGFYVCADRVQSHFEKRVDQKVRDRIAVVARESPRFRKALREYEGKLILILPDPAADRVRAHFRQRADLLGLSEDELYLIGTQARREFSRIRRERKRRNRETFLHKTPALPESRLFASWSKGDGVRGEGVCLIQEFPRDAFGVCAPVREIRKDTNPTEFGIVYGFLYVLAGVL